MGGSDSFLRVGTDVELWRVAIHLCVLLACVVLLEHVLHRLEHALQRYPKYFEMLRKVYRELMILGLLALGTKAVKALALTHYGSRNLVAFEAADVVLFLSAVALIVQAAAIFLLLRGRNKRVDKYELVPTRDLIDLVSHHQAVLRMKGWLPRHLPWTRSTGLTLPSLSTAECEDMTRLRVLRHFFLRSQGLPELFPFAKYLRHAQDNQISHMIQVELSVWVLLLGVTWLLASTTRFLHDRLALDDGLALALGFVLFAWGLTLLHVLLTLYLRRLLRAVLASCGYASRCNALQCLRAVASDEDTRLASDLLDNALDRMQRVQDEQELQQAHKDAKYSGLARRDSGLQLLVLLARRLRCCASPAPAAASYGNNQQRPPPPACRRLHTADVDDDFEGYARGTSECTAKETTLQPTGTVVFSRKAIHFLVKLVLILNGFFVALTCQAVLYELPVIYTHSGLVATLLVPMPLALNMGVFQPRIFRDYVLVACPFKVDVATLSEVISHLSESVEMRVEFVGHLTARMQANGQTLADLQCHLRVSDAAATGLVELEELRQILRFFGCQISYYRFHDVAKLLFRLQGTRVEYAHVERMVARALAEDEERRMRKSGGHIATGPVAVAVEPHYLRVVMMDEAEFQGRERVSTLLAGDVWVTPDSESFGPLAAPVLGDDSLQISIADNGITVS